MKPTAELSTTAWFGYFKRLCSRFNQVLYRYPEQIQPQNTQFSDNNADWLQSQSLLSEIVPEKSFGKICYGEPTTIYCGWHKSGVFQDT